MNELIPANDLRNELITSPKSFCSMAVTSNEERKALYRAMNNPDKRLKDCINLTINVRDIYVETVELTNPETGELLPNQRIVLIDTDGVSYQCVSVGIFSALKKLIQLFGAPTWDDGLPVVVKQINKKDRSMLTLELA